MKTAQTTRYSLLTKHEVTKLHKVVHPFHSFLLPSIVHLWYNSKDLSEITYGHDFALGALHPHTGGSFWCMSTQDHLSSTKLTNILAHVPTGKRLQHIEHSGFSMDMQENYPNSILINSDAPDFYDYIYNVRELADCLGKKYEDTRRHIRRFFDLYGPDMQIKILTGWEDIRRYRHEMLELFDDWTHFSTEGSKSYQDEQRAFGLFLDHDASTLFGSIITVLFFNKDRLVGYSINEIFNDRYAINHFHKANLNLSSISHYMFYSVAEVLTQMNIDFLNFQEDCGIAGLRAFKHKMRPAVIFETRTISLGSVQ
jgi:hypothetical protein